MKNKIIFLALAILLVVPFASAFEFDNAKQFNQTFPQYGKAKIINAYGYGAVLAEVVLQENTYFCAERCEAIIDMDLKEEYNNPFQQIDFKKKDKNNWVDSSVEHEIWIKSGTVDKVIDDFTQSCSTINHVNGTSSEDCAYVKNGTKTIKEPSWMRFYSGTTLPQGQYTFKIVGYKNADETVDFIPQFLGVKVTEWAQWVGYETAEDKVFYYRFNQSSGSAIDEVGTYLAPLVSTITYNATGGLAGYGNYTSTPLTTAGINTTFLATQANLNAFTVEFRIRLNHTTRSYVMASGTGADASTFGWYAMINNQAGKMTLGVMNGTAVLINEADLGCPATSMTNNAWHHVAITKNSTNAWTVYQDGVACTTVSVANMTQTTNYRFMLFNRPTMTTGLIGSLDQVIWWNRTLTVAEIISANASTADGSIPDRTMVVATNLILPINGTNVSITSVILNATVLPTYANNTNVTFFLWNSSSAILNQTTVALSSSINNTILNMSLVGVTDGTLFWNAYGCAINGTDHLCAFNNTNYTLIKDTTGPSITIARPLADEIIITPNNISLNYSVSDAIVGLGSCWWNLDNGVNATLVSCANSTFVASVGDHTLNLFANDTLNNIATKQVNFTAVNLSIARTYVNPIIENANNQINNTINITGSSVQVNSGSLIYNGTSTSSTNISTVYSASPSPALITESVNATKNIYWSYNMTYRSYSAIVNSSVVTQSVNRQIFTIANVTYPTQFLNITFKDELSLASLNATISSSSFTFYETSGLTSLTRTYTYSNSTENVNYAFSGHPPFIRLQTSGTVSYASAIVATYPMRTYVFNSTLTNATTSVVLYLLKSTDGQYVTFQVINSALAPISGVTVTATSPTGVVGQGTTDAAGTITLWLNPLTSHTFVFEKTGYSTLTEIITPSQTSYTVTLNQLGTSNVTDPYNGLTYTIAPADSYLSNGTVYNFNLTLVSTVNNVTDWGYSLVNSSGFVFTSNTSVSNGGFLRSLVNTGANRTIAMNGYYTVEGTNYTFVRVWVIQDVAGTGYSVLNVFTNLKTYVNSGFFGLDPFGLNLIIFLVIFVSSGVISWKFGIYSPAAVSGIIFAETFVFDVGLGLVTSTGFAAAVPNMPTLLMGIICLALVIKEGTNF